MKILISETLFDKEIFYQSWYNGETYGGKVVEVDDRYRDCVREDFDGFEFNLQKYNARNLVYEKNKKLNNLIENLNKTDYIANKLAEAVSKYISTGDNTDVLLLREKYALELVNREQWRKEVDKLQQELKLLDK